MSIITKSELSVIATELAYKLKKPHTYQQKEEIACQDLSKTGWEVLCRSSDYKESNQSGYKSVALFNDMTKEVHIATAGTDLWNRHDLRDDAMLVVLNLKIPAAKKMMDQALAKFVGQDQTTDYMNRIDQVLNSAPSKIAPAKHMIDQVIAKLGGQDQAKDYIFSTSGHSLGAVISDLTAADIISRGLEFTESTTFESPGSLCAVQRAKEQNLFTKPLPISIAELATHCKVYNSKPNVINQAFQHLGDVALKLHADIESKSTTQYTWGSHLFNKVGSALLSCSKYLGLTNVSTLLENPSLQNIYNLLTEHSLPKNSKDIENGDVLIPADDGSMQGNKIIIENSPHLDKITSTGSDLITITSEEKPGGAVLINSQTYSYSDLQSNGNFARYSHTEGYDVIGHESYIYTEDYEIVR